MLVTTHIPEQYGVFHTHKITAQGTTKIAEPAGGGSVRLTDLMVNFEKKNLATIEVRFNDDTYTKTVFYADLTDGNVNISHSFRGKCQGWSGAWLEVVEANADADGSVYVGYVKYAEEESLSYSDWDNAR
jgi:hypothetical protein